MAAQATTQVQVQEQTDLQAELESLLQTNRAYFICFAQRILHNREDAEDAVQETAILAFQRLDQYSGYGTLRNWFRTILSNSALTLLRRRWDTDDLEPENVHVQVRMTVPPTQLQDMLDRERMTALMKAMDGLDGALRGGIRFGEDVGRPMTPTEKTRRFRAIHRVRTVLGRRGIL